MRNALSELLERKPPDRRVEDYERTFDDYIAFAGGRRIDQLIEIRQGAGNADYLIPTDALDLVVELKQIHAYAKPKSVDRFFEKLLNRGQVRNPQPLGATRLQIGPDSLSLSQWNHFYSKFRPSVGRQLDKAAGQLKSTALLLPMTNRRRAFGVILINTGDYNLPVDLMQRLVEFHAKRKWKVGRFSHVDFVICLMMDMVKAGQHPLHGRGLVRTVEDAPLADAVRQLFDRWIRYGASAVGAEVTFREDSSVEADPLEMSGGVTGKIVIVP